MALLVSKQSLDLQSVARLIGADAASTVGIASVTALKMRTSGMATTRLMLAEFWKLLLFVKAVERS